MLFASEDDRILIRFTLEDAHSPTFFRFKPFLAFRNVHTLTHANVDVNSKYEKVENGIRMKLYNGFSHLYMQFSKDAEYVHVPQWYYNIEYWKDQQRGYPYVEDLFVPGFFELPVKKGDSVIFSAGIEEVNPVSLKRFFTTEVRKRVPRDSFYNCLVNSAQQFIVRRNKKVEVIAGYPWFGRWGRDTFISLPGLTLSTDDPKTCKAAIDTLVAQMSGALFPNLGEGSAAAFNSVDAPLWFFWTLQQYAGHTGTASEIWKEYGNRMKNILYGYRDGCGYNIKMQDDGLIYAGEQGRALTWMDAVVNGKPVTPRIGKAVEINALWYNAVMFALETARLAGDEGFVQEWQELSYRIPASFKSCFWNKDKGYLCDYADGDYRDWSVRPNMIFAASLPYNPVSEQIRKLIVDKVEKELLTPRGLRTLSPQSHDYHGSYDGDITQRDLAYHQGTVWPWLTGHFVEALLKIHGKNGIPKADRIFKGFEEVMIEHGVGSVSEVYDGDPPHKAGGAPSQAWSVAELLRMKVLIDKCKYCDE